MAWRRWWMVGLVPFLLGADAAPAETPLALAQQLIQEIAPANNAYASGQAHITWKGDNGAAEYAVNADCCGFLTALLERAYHLDDAGMKAWLGTARPSPVTYLRAIEKQNRFLPIARLADARPGDVIAIRYPKGEKNVGHIMLLAGPPTTRPATAPLVPDTQQWEVPIIDSTGSGHGKTDTRRQPDGSFNSGAGQGIFRLYTDAAGTVHGHTWSVSSHATYFSQDVRYLVIGRPPEPRAAAHAEETPPPSR